jgi:hypothetical protein
MFLEQQRIKKFVAPQISSLELKNNRISTFHEYLFLQEQPE